ncbi:MAG: hypothetical protein JJU09_03615 [Rhodobacteraceae bacterium]|nr:hypothetical protein [Paracoccaceae bacterium]
MMNTLMKFVNSESGAVTVDWVVLTAATCLLGAVIVLQIKGPQDGIGEQIETSLSAGAETLPNVSFE